MSEIVLRGTIVNKPRYYSNEGKTALLTFRVRTELDVEGSKPISGVHSVSVWGSLAEEWEGELREGDGVEVRGRLTYEKPRDPDEPWSALVSVDGEQDGDLRLLDDDETDENEVSLEGRVEAEPYFSKDRDGKKASCLFAKVWTAVDTGRSKPSLAGHTLVAFDEIAERLGDELRKGDRVKVVGRLQYVRNPSTDQYEPRVTVDDFRGEVELVK